AATKVVQGLNEAVEAEMMGVTRASDRTPTQLSAEICHH
ncbi:hypothetical protein A2U01_0113642, partial [Trifolium medium]|nr:hypothetical protein [Trifolium medium]